jgi:uncharacterized protein (TIGR02186 family)
MFLLLLLPQAGHARAIVADLAIRNIDIDHNFKGIEILLFGAREDVGDVVVVVRGPERKYTVHRKQRVAGIWVNRRALSFAPASSFYAIASSRPLESIKNDQLLNMLGIGVDHIQFEPLEHASEEKLNEFKTALIHYEQSQHLYPSEPEEVSFWGDTLFRTVITFPKNIIGGWYTAEVYLFSDGQLVGLQTTPLKVSKIGFEALVYDFAHEHPLLYGITAVFLALLAGWTASVTFKKV